MDKDEEEQSTFETVVRQNTEGGSPLSQEGPVLIGELTLRRITIALCISFVLFHLQVVPVILASTHCECKKCRCAAIPQFMVTACFVVWFYVNGYQYLELKAAHKRQLGRTDHPGAGKYHLILCLMLSAIAALSVALALSCWMKHCH